MDFFDYKYKIVLIGNSNTGKTSLTTRFITNQYKEKNVTIGTEYSSKIISVDGKKIKLVLWDTAGQERFADVIKVFYRDADAIIITFDITNYKSFSDMKNWIQKVKNNTTKNPYIIIVATKIDMEYYREIDNFDLLLFMDNEDNNYDYIEVSSKDGTNIENLFEIITENLLKKNKTPDNNSYINKINNAKKYMHILNWSYCSMQ